MARTRSLGRSGKAASYSARVLGSKSTGWESMIMIMMRLMMVMTMMVMIMVVMMVMIMVVMMMMMMMMYLMMRKKHSFQKSSTAKWRRAL